MSNETKRLMPIHSAAYDKVVMTESSNGDYVDYEDYLLLSEAHKGLLHNMATANIVSKSEYDDLVQKIKELKENDKRSFFSGLAVALQSLSLWNQKTIADEIVDGLGSEKEPFYSYLESEGGIDAQTLEFLKGQE